MSSKSYMHITPACKMSICAISMKARPAGKRPEPAKPRRW